MSSQLCQEIECVEAPLDATSDDPLHLYCYEHAKKHGADVSGFKPPMIEEAEEEIAATPPQTDSPHIKRPAPCTTPRKTDGPLHSRQAREMLAQDAEGAVYKYASLNQLGKAMGTSGSNLIKFVREGRRHHGYRLHYADEAPADLRTRAVPGGETLVRRKRVPATEAAPKEATAMQPAPQVAMTVSPTVSTPPRPACQIQEVFCSDHSVITARRACLQRQIRELQMEDFQLAAKQEYVEEKLALLQE